MSESAPKAEPAGTMTRKRILRLLFGGALVAAIGSAVKPVWDFFHPAGPPPPIPPGSKIVAGEVGKIPPGSAKSFFFVTRPAMVIHSKDGQWHALDAVCSHRHCTVGFRPADESIVCPCHGGRYELSGHCISGPPKEPLGQLDVEIRGERVIVTKRA